VSNSSPSEELPARSEEKAFCSPDPQVIPGTSEFGNRYPRAYKLQILQETDACTKPGQLGQLLRRAGLTHATLTCFRRQRATGALQVPHAAGKHQSTSATSLRLLELEQENRRLKRQLQQAEAIVDLQKKVSRLLELSFEPPEPSSPF